MRTLFLIASLVAAPAAGQVAVRGASPPILCEGQDISGVHHSLLVDGDGGLVVLGASGGGGGGGAVTQSGNWAVNAVIDGGVNVSGSVSVSNFPGTQPVSGSVSVSNFPATQAVTQSGSWTDAVTQSGVWNVNLDGGVSQGGTWNVNLDGGVQQGTAAATAGAWPVKVTDGTNVNTVKAASTAATATDTSLVVQLNPNQPALTASLLVQGKSATNLGVTNPFLAAGRAVADAAAPTAVTAGNQGSAIEDLYGRLMVQDFHPNHWTCNLGATSTLTQCQATPGAGLSLYVTDVIFSPTLAGTLTLTAGTGTNCASTSVTFAGPYAVAAASTIDIPMRTPFKLTANTELCCSPSTSATCTVSGFTAP
jgi:hypothetical protein